MLKRYGLAKTWLCFAVLLAALASGCGDDQGAEEPGLGFDGAATGLDPADTAGGAGEFGGGGEADPDEAGAGEGGQKPDAIGADAADDAQLSADDSGSEPTDGGSQDQDTSGPGPEDGLGDDDSEAGGEDSGEVPVESCAQLIVCTGGCGADSTCHTACDAKATAQAKLELTAFETCSVVQCGGLQGDDYLRCMYKNCLSETTACWAGGTQSCTQALECAVPCSGSANIGDCLAGCAGLATSEAFSALASLWLCVDSKCTTAADFCQAAAWFMCHAEGNACGTFKGNANCSATMQCLLACGDANCFYGCYSSASLSAAQKAGALTGCLLQHCGESAPSACVETETGIGGKCSTQALGCFL